MLKIDSIKIHGKEYTCSKVNIILGANNAGKSTLLSTIHNGLMSQITPEIDPLLIMNVSIENSKSLLSEIVPEIDTIQTYEEIPNFSQKTIKLQNSENIPWGQQFFSLLKADSDAIKTLSIQPGQNVAMNILFQFYITMLTSYENSGSRLQGVFRTEVKNLTNISKDHIGHLIRNKDILKIVQDNIKDTFGFKIGFDNLMQGDKPIRILPSSNSPYKVDSVAAAQWWEENSKLIENQGDGIRAYMKIILSLLQPYKHLILIDEPETYLHPPQRRALGTTIAKLAAAGNKQVFLATHDPDILRGILNSNLGDISLIHLMRENETFSSRQIESSDINTIIRAESNLLAEKLLSSFFYQVVILCESENDRVFYENSAARYYWQLFQNVNFIGLNGDRKAAEIFNYLKSLNLNVRLIVDIDFLMDNHLPSIITDLAIKTEYSNVKRDINSLIASNSLLRNKIKKDGFYYFKNSNPTIYSRLETLFTNLKSFGIYIVPVGEMESWTKVAKNDITTALNIVEAKKIFKLRKFLLNIMTI